VSGINAIALALFRSSIVTFLSIDSSQSMPSVSAFIGTIAADQVTEHEAKIVCPSRRSWFVRSAFMKNPTDD
jgi:hypothetical protein